MEERSKSNFQHHSLIRSTERVDNRVRALDQGEGGGHVVKQLLGFSIDRRGGER